MSFDINQPVQTRNGLEVRILCTDANLPTGETIIGIVNDNVYTWHPDGKLVDTGEERTFDLVNKCLEAWLNIYMRNNEPYLGYLHATLESAQLALENNIQDSGYGITYVATKRIQFTPGDKQ